MFDDLIGRTYEQVGKCYGLCRIVCRRLGIDLPPMNDVCADQANDEIERRRHLFRPVTDGRPGDLVHIRNFEGPAHVGVLVSASAMLQVTRGHRVHRIRLDHIWIRSRIVGVYRYAG